MIANAGIAPPVTTVAGVDPDAFERVIDINLLGVWRTVRATLPHVRARRGYILCIASMAAAVHAPLMAPYNMAKAGVEALADSLRPELAGDGVAVGCAYFGFIDTDMVRDSLRGEPDAAAAGQHAVVARAPAAGRRRGTRHRARHRAPGPPRRRAPRRRSRSCSAAASSSPSPTRARAARASRTSSASVESD